MDNKPDFLQCNLKLASTLAAHDSAVICMQDSRDLDHRAKWQPMTLQCSICKILAILTIGANWQATHDFAVFCLQDSGDLDH